MLLLSFSQNKEKFKFNLSFCNGFCLKLCGFYKANRDSQWAKIAFCRLWKEVKKDGVGDEICMGVNVVREKCSKLGKSGKARV